MSKNLTTNAAKMAAGAPAVNKICNRYVIDVLENNWNEERFDVAYLKTDKPLQSDYQHYYETTYSDYEAKFGVKNLDTNLILARKHRLNAFPGHQPELDTDFAKVRANTYQTEHRVHYMDPKLKKVPINLRQELLREAENLESQKK